MARTLTHDQQLTLIRGTGQFHAQWYLDTYPDAAASGLPAIEHYLRIGAALGRNPGKQFETRFYLKSAGAAASGLNPLVHYALEGRARGLPTRAPAPDTSAEVLARTRERFRNRLMGLGFTAEPLAELAAAATDPAAPAVMRATLARDLAMWHARRRDPAGWTEALDWLARARSDATDMAFRSRLALLEQICLYHLGRGADAEAAYEAAALAGEVSPDVMLSRVNWQPDPQARLALINAVLDHHAIPGLRFLPDDGRGLAPYDRLTAAVAPPAVTDGPKVTVLIAAYDAGATLPTALRALQEQSWRNLEIIVLDDHSPDPATMRVATEFAAADPRIRAIRMPVNAGAYVARNHGLDLATGDHVTLHDADDWVHPLRIETQVRHLAANAGLIGCKSEQARATSDLGFTRWTGDGGFTIPNTSSFMFRRAPMRTHFGYWDTVRFSADNELVRRMRKVLGHGAVEFLRTGPLAFQRDSDTSIVADEVLGINGFLFGARKEYYEAQIAFHAGATPEALHYDGQKAGQPRPFPAPAAMHPDRPAPGTDPVHLPVVLGTEWRMQGGSIESSLEDLRALQGFGLPTASFQISRYDLGSRLNMLDAVRSEMTRLGTRQLVYGDRIRCDVLLLRYPPALWHDQRYLPQIEAREIRVIVNQPPQSDYGPGGVQRYDLAACQDNIRRWFGKEAVWHPIGPLVREALLTHHADELGSIRLADDDWNNIIDIAGWDRVPRRPHPAGKLRIGRHSRDNPNKWPDRAEDILAAWPEADDVEIHVLGGSRAAEAVLGRRPRNWVVHPFGAMHPRDFLAGVDVFTYFSHPGWVESFGRTIIEAMAAGVPVILPAIYRPLFADAALYATPQEAGDLARRLWADPAGYAAQAVRARDFVLSRFSHDRLRQRLVAAGATGL